MPSGPMGMENPSQRTKTKSVRREGQFCKRMGRETIAHLNGHSLEISGDAKDDAQVHSPILPYKPINHGQRTHL